MTIKLPDKLQQEYINFVLLDKNSKKPFEKEWPTKNIKYNSPELLTHIANGGNYGIIGGGEKNLIILDFDDKTIQEEIIKKLPNTFTIKTGSGLLHKYFFSDKSESFKIFNKNFDTIIDIQGKGKQVVGPDSIHPNGNKYEIIDNSNIEYIDYAEIKALLEPYNKKIKNKIEKKIIKNINTNFIEELKSLIKLEDVLSDFGVDITKNPSNCPFHTSKGGKCLGWNNKTAHCFHCEGSWNIISWIKDNKKCNTKEAIDYLVDKAGITDKLKEHRLQHIKKTTITNKNPELSFVFERINQAEEFIKVQPIYYERKHQFWFWDFNNFCWVEKDEIDLLNSIRKLTYIDTTNSKNKTEILDALKQVGREQRPQEIKPSWIQFKDMIYDIETGEKFKASPKYFVSNPINWKLGKNEETPIIDKLFENWVGKEDKQKLYEIIAFTLVPKHFIHSFFFIYSPPGYGKSTFVNLIIKFIGDMNYVATSIDRINKNSRFETKNWYKKLLITMSEVSNVNDLKNSGLINQATGEDPISAEIKGGESFNFTNYGKFIYPTNKIFKVDENDGFGRRVRKINFLKRFEKEKDVLNQIPDEEFENLALKSLNIAKKLWGNRRFTGDVSISERIKQYQEASKSNIEKFIDNFCDLTDYNAKTLFDEFYSKYSKCVNSKESKIIVSKELKKFGFEIKLENWRDEKIKTLDGSSTWISGTRISGLRLNE